MERREGAWSDDLESAGDSRTERPSLEQIRVIGFDGDMTLWDFHRVMREALEKTLQEIRRRCPGTASEELTVEEMVRIRNAVAWELDGEAIKLEEVRRLSFVRTLEAIGLPDEALAAELNAFYLQHRFEGITPYPDVIPCLDALRSRFTIGMISNGNGYPERCGFGDRFEFVVFSEDLGIRKPAPEIFREACRQGGFRPDEMAYVGDSLKADVAGAAGVGAISVWLNREGVANDSGIQPDYEVRSLSEVPDIFEFCMPRGENSG